ncbi:MAG: lasso peptide biosynthesis PqqD family chaperone [Thermincola sp.]|jgi:hypothetical protein|nr:lasso peptide biosynthesis PqqD family chaperone [Thermincola sp.]MDT3704280.1 lasso peptide biosynthesis PqqD family chaperone [Thermincola sp.]
MNKYQNLALHDTVAQAEGNTVGVMDGEKVILSIQNGKYYNLGQTGSRIWELIGTPLPVNHLINQLTKEYEIETRECEGQVVSFLDHLLGEGLIRTDNGGS